MAHNPRFPSFLQDVRRRWQLAVAEREREQPLGPLDIVVAFFCRMGRHRSVAVAELFSHIGKEVENLHVREVKHLSKPHWSKNMCKGGCEECRSDSQDRKDALKKAESIWLEAPRTR